MYTNHSMWTRGGTISSGAFSGASRYIYTDMCNYTYSKGTQAEAYLKIVPTQMTWIETTPNIKLVGIKKILSLKKLEYKVIK